MRDFIPYEVFSQQLEIPKEVINEIGRSFVLISGLGVNQGSFLQLHFVPNGVPVDQGNSHKAHRVVINCNRSDEGDVEVTRGDLDTTPREDADLVLIALVLAHKSNMEIGDVVLKTAIEYLNV